MNNIFILTEEKPKCSVIKQLLDIYKNDFHGHVTYQDKIIILPIIVDGYFKFEYEVLNVSVEGIERIVIKTVSGGSSFMDFLFFVQPRTPAEDSITNNLLFAVEETKTSDDESRNTGVYQRCSKFVYITAFYQVPCYMLYNEDLELRESKKPSDTSIFGTDMLLTVGVKFVGKPIDDWFDKFSSIDELISFKSGMRKPPAGNIPITITKKENQIFVSGRLDKPDNIGKIAHDPNIGALSIIAYTLRKLGWTGDIIITMHQVTQTYITGTQGKNKFLYICKILDIKLDGIVMPSSYELPESYWHYETKSEKMASILLHVAGECIGLTEVYQNHAGCERGYFKTLGGSLITLPKKTPTGVNLLIPDLILRDDVNRLIYLIEGKQLRTINDGLREIELYDDIESLYINHYYPGYKVARYLTIFGGNLSALPNNKILLYLSSSGKIIVNSSESELKNKIKGLAV